MLFRAFKNTGLDEVIKESVRGKCTCEELLRFNGGEKRKKN